MRIKIDQLKAEGSMSLPDVATFEIRHVYAKQIKRYDFASKSVATFERNQQYKLTCNVCDRLKEYVGTSPSPKDIPCID